MNMTLKEAYEILNINDTATLDEARIAYHTVVNKYDSNIVQLQINEAYEMVIKELEDKKLGAEIRKSQEEARAKAQAKAREQEKRELLRRQSIERERLRRIKRIYSDLNQSKEFKKQNISEEYFIENINKPECAKWGNIHLYASSIYTRRERYIKEYAAKVDMKNSQIDTMVPFTKLNPNPITHNKKSAYKAMINKKYGTMGDAITTVYKMLLGEINYLSKCIDFTEESIIAYLISDDEYQSKIFKKAENKLHNYYKIAKYIASKPECARDIDEVEFLSVRSSKYQKDIIRMKTIESYVNRVYTFKEDGTIGINNTSITRSEYQKAREWLMVVRNNNLGKVEHSTIIVYMNYIAGCMQYIYRRIPHPEFNPNVDPNKLLDIAKVIGTLEKYYILAQEESITDCYNTYLKVKNKAKYKGRNMSQVLEELLDLNKKRKIINKYYLHAYYSLEELIDMNKDDVNTLYSKALGFKKDMELYLKERPNGEELVELYLKKLKDNKKFAPLFNDDVTLIDIMNFLEVKRHELDSYKLKDKPALATFIFMSSGELMALKEAPLFEIKREFILEHNEKYSKNDGKKLLDSLSNKQLDQMYRETVIELLNNNLPRFKNNPLNFASLGRLDTKKINSLIEQAEDERITKKLLEGINKGIYKIEESDVRAATSEERKKMLQELDKKYNN